MWEKDWHDGRVSGILCTLMQQASRFGLTSWEFYGSDMILCSEEMLWWSLSSMPFFLLLMREVLRVKAWPNWGWIWTNFEAFVLGWEPIFHASPSWPLGKEFEMYFFKLCKMSIVVPSIGVGGTPSILWIQILWIEKIHDFESYTSWWNLRAI